MGKADDSTPSPLLFPTTFRHRQVQFRNPQTTPTSSPKCQETGALSGSNCVFHCSKSLARQLNQFRIFSWTIMVIMAITPTTTFK